jgi:ABC-type Mn2+/Zn2+ transport system ATPase subunit
MNTVQESVTSEPLFVGQKLTLGYGRQVIVRNLSFEVHRGHILGIVGPNGSGKTTLLRTMLGLLKPLNGTVERTQGLAISYMQQRERIDTILPITASRHGGRSSAWQSALLVGSGKRSPNRTGDS